MLVPIMGGPTYKSIVNFPYYTLQNWTKTRAKIVREAEKQKKSYLHQTSSLRVMFSGDVGEQVVSLSFRFVAIVPTHTYTTTIFEITKKVIIIINKVFFK